VSRSSGEELSVSDKGPLRMHLQGKTENRYYKTSELNKEKGVLS